MMRPSNDISEVYLCRDSVDFRKGINGLAVLVEEALYLDPFSEKLFVFCNRRRNRIKILYWSAVGSACGRSAWRRLASTGPARWQVKP